MSTEMPIGLSRLRGDDGQIAEPRVAGWEAPSQESPLGLGKLSLHRQEPLVPARQPALNRPVIAVTPAAVPPQVTPLDKGEAMEALMALSQVLLQETDPARRRERWMVIRQQLENMLQ